jgi:hypothetical protein
MLAYHDQGLRPGPLFGVGRPPPSQAVVNVEKGHT